MSVTLAELNSRVFLGLEAAGEYLTLDKVHNAIIQRLNVRTMQSRDSSTNVLIAVTPEFTPDTDTYDTTALIGDAQACWLESKWNIIDQIEEWYPVRIVPLVQIADYKNMGAFAAAFYTEEPNSPTERTSSFVRFTFLPAKPCRIRFNRNIVRMELDAETLLPDQFADLIVLEAECTLISRIKLNLSMGLRRDAEGQKTAPAVLAALSEVYMQNMADIVPLDALWKVWAFRDKAEATSFNKVAPNGRDMYGGNWGGIGYGNGYGGY